jgi:hypothetical protein
MCLCAAIMANSLTMSSDPSTVVAQNRNLACAAADKLGFTEFPKGHVQDAFLSVDGVEFLIRATASVQPAKASRTHRKPRFKRAQTRYFCVHCTKDIKRKDRTPNHARSHGLRSGGGGGSAGETVAGYDEGKDDAADEASDDENEDGSESAAFPEQPSPQEVIALDLPSAQAGSSRLSLCAPILLFLIN